MPISLESPNVENYLVGKGIVYFKPEGAGGSIDDYRVGNVTEFELSPTVEKLDHFSSQEGIKTKDKSIIVSAGMSARMVMEEFTPRNLRLMLLGEPDEGDPSNVTIDIMSEQSVTGQLKFVATNEVGPKWTFDLPAVSFTPSGSINPISDEWGNIEVTGEVVKTDGTFGTASSDFSDAAAPTNTLLPSISGIAQDTHVLTAVVGTWTGNPVFTYVWQVDDGGGYDPIVGATAKTLLVATAQVGYPIRCVVTGTNGIGNLAKTTAPTADVLAA